MQLLICLYVGEILVSLVSDITFQIRYKNLKEELGYLNVKRGELSSCFAKEPFTTTLVIFLHYLSPFTFISSIRDNLEFKYSSLDEIKEELDKGVIKLKDEEELDPVELVHKIKGVRKSVAALYLNYLDELGKKQEENMDKNNFFKPDTTDLDKKKEELKKLQLRFDSTMRHNYAREDDE